MDARDTTDPNDLDADHDVSGGSLRMSPPPGSRSGGGDTLVARVPLDVCGD
jgi:hypothetical protein